MKQLFLYKLFRHSVFAFSLAALFIGCYCILFSKKMDMILFPYNSMYSIDFGKKDDASTYALKIDDSLVKISSFPYWKKDFLETSLNGYCKYLQHDKKVFMSDYLHYKFKNEKIRNYLLQQLTPNDTLAGGWLSWFGRFAGYRVSPNSRLELLQFHFVFENGMAVLKDSLSIYKTIVP